MSMATQFDTDSFYPSSITYQIPNTGEQDPANWVFQTNGIASQSSRFQHKAEPFNDCFTLDPSLYVMQMADLGVYPDMEDGRFSWNYEAPDARLASGQDSLSRDYLNDGLTSETAVINQPERPGVYSSSTLSPLSSRYQPSLPSRSNSTSSANSLVEEQPSQTALLKHGPKRSCRRASSSPSNVENKLLNPSLKRQSTTANRQLCSPKKTRERTRKSHAAKVTRHSLVEKRYRTKMNDSLGRLRDKVPSLRVITKKSEEYAYREGQEKLDRPQAASKFDKASVVSKAIEYIIYIEMCNMRLSEENALLMNRIKQFQVSLDSPHLDNPFNFFTRIQEPPWLSFTTTLHTPTGLFFEHLAEFTGNEPGTGALTTFKDSYLGMSIVIPHQPHFINQSADVQVFWGYGLTPNAVGNYVQKPISRCSGEEIFKELLALLRFPLHSTRDNAITNPCLMPYITSQLLTRGSTDCPAVIPEGTTNLAFLGQLVEIEEDVVFIIEYDVRSAQEALYGLIGLKKQPTRMYHVERHPRVLSLALKTLLEDGTRWGVGCAADE